MDSNIFNNTSVAKIIVNDKCIYLKIVWKEEENEILFNMGVFDGDNVWTGVFSNDLVEKCSKRVVQTKQEYITNIKNSVIKCNKEFTFDFIVHSGDTATFKWTQKYEGSTAILEYASVTLQRNVSEESKDCLVDFLIDWNSHLRTSLKENVDHIEKLNVDISTYKEELEKYCNIKTTLEEELYGKFIKVLNQKKRRIQLLEDEINKLT